MNTLQSNKIAHLLHLSDDQVTQLLNRNNSEFSSYYSESGSYCDCDVSFSDDETGTFRNDSTTYSASLIDDIHDGMRNMNILTLESAIPRTIERSQVLGHLVGKSAHRYGVTNIQSLSAQEGKEDEDTSVVKPQDLLFSLLHSKGISARKIPSSTMDDFFFLWTDKNKEAYAPELVAAVRLNDISKVKRLHTLENKNLLACNKFGESVVNTICRKGHHELLQYFMEEANVTVQLRDDCGRTPLHDSCWTSNPNFDCVKLLLSACPDLLLISDNRCFTPLEYIPRSQWSVWCSFLEENVELIIPQVLF